MARASDPAGGSAGRRHHPLPAKFGHGSVLNAYFAMDCQDLIQQPVLLWVHGHTHALCDCSIRRVRVVCNPRGAVGRGGVANPKFNSDLIVTLR